MKNYLLLALSLSFITACSATQSQDPMKIGMPNPASQYCVEQGGKLEIKNEANGQVGYCHLPDGRVVEEWELYRASQAKCLPEQAKKLVGQRPNQLTDEKIKQLTQATVVRWVELNQPMTMDYREDRVTIVTSPSTNLIMKASCG